MKLAWRMADAGWYWRSQIFKQIMLIKSAVPTGAQACIALIKPFLAVTKRTEKLRNWEPVNRAQKQTVLQNPNKINPGGSQDSGVKLTTTFLLAEEGDQTPISSPVNAAGHWQLLMTPPQVHTLKLLASHLEEHCKGEHNKYTRKEIFLS